MSKILKYTITPPTSLIVPGIAFVIALIESIAKHASSTFDLSLFGQICSYIVLASIIAHTALYLVIPIAIKLAKIIKP